MLPSILHPDETLYLGHFDSSYPFRPVAAKNV